ncbi:hypothetical protein OUZ56_005647 [Daphnia magna]|uniref:Uncharacterized protein n=1 Tax=Daphnia magna TaxID=35525 RepID=A0ABQ9YTN0_9CRUS|nr:hypothetical protein OUZ56_005647 [Daphnia magna]
MPPENSRVHKRSASALSNASNVSTQSTISIEFYDNADESAEMQSTNEASSLAGQFSSQFQFCEEKLSFKDRLI